MSQPRHPLPTRAFVSRVSPGCPRGCHCLSPADIMADKEGVTLSLEEEEDDADVALAYKTPEKKSLQEIQELDPGDESLRKYKQALLGAIPAAVGKAGGCGRVWAQPSPGCGPSGRGELGRERPEGHPRQGGLIPAGIARGRCLCPPPAQGPRHSPPTERRCPGTPVAVVTGSPPQFP